MTLRQWHGHCLFDHSDNGPCFFVEMGYDANREMKCDKNDRGNGLYRSVCLSTLKVVIPCGE